MRPLSNHPETVRTRQHVQRLRRELFRILGNRCQVCGAGPDEAKLEPHHTTARTWRSRDYFLNVRLMKYIEDAIAGRVELLCSDCNKIEGPPDGDDNF
jgi:hypothetical protein